MRHSWEIRPVLEESVPTAQGRAPCTGTSPGQVEVVGATGERPALEGRIQALGRPAARLPAEVDGAEARPAVPLAEE